MTSAFVHPRMLRVQCAVASSPLRPSSASLGRRPLLLCALLLWLVIALVGAQDSSSSSSSSGLNESSTAAVPSSTGSSSDVIDPAYFPLPRPGSLRVRFVFSVAGLPASAKATSAELDASVAAGNPNSLSLSFPEALGTELVLFFQQLASDYDDAGVDGVALTRDLLVSRVFFASPMAANSDLSRVTLLMEWAPLPGLFQPSTGYVRLKNDIIDARGDHRYQGYPILSQIVGLAAYCLEPGSEFEGSYALACGPDPPPEVREANWWWAGLCGVITMVAETLFLGILAFQLQRLLTPDVKLSAQMDDLRARKLAKEVAKIQAAQLAAQGGIPTVPIAMQPNTNQVGQAPDDDEYEEANIVIPMHGEEDDAMNTASISSKSRAHGDGTGKSPLFAPAQRNDSVSMTEFGRARDEPTQLGWPAHLGHGGHHSHNPLSMGGSMDFALVSPSHRNNMSSVSGFGAGGLAPVDESEDEPRRRTAAVPEEDDDDSAAPQQSAPRKFQLLRQDTREALGTSTGTPRAVREESFSVPLLGAAQPRAVREESFSVLPSPQPRAVREESFVQTSPGVQAIMPAARPTQWASNSGAATVPLSPQQPTQIITPVARRPIQVVAAPAAATTPGRPIVPVAITDGAPRPAISPPLHTVPLGQPSPSFGQHAATAPPYALALASQQANTGVTPQPQQPGPSPSKRSVMRDEDDD